MPRAILPLIAAVSIVVIAVCALAQRGSAAPPRAPAAPPAVQWVGPDTRRAEPGFVLVRDDGAWRSLWAQHTGKPLDQGTEHRYAAPMIDFDHCMALAYFRGPATNSDGEIATSVSDEADHITLRFESSGFQTFGPGPDGGAVHTSPYGIWIIPLSSKPVIVEEGTRELKDEPLKWKEVKRFPAREATR
jgi:hypothetical protein